MLHYFGFTIQLALLRVFNVKMKNLSFDTSKVITNAWFSMKNYPGLEKLVGMLGIFVPGFMYTP